MTDRPCKRSDLRLLLDYTPEIGVDDEGAPIAADLKRVADRLVTDWRSDDFGWIIACGNCWEDFPSFEDALRHLPEDGKAHMLRRVGRPRRGRVRAADQQLVREHLAEVNAYLAADDFRQIDPSDPKHAARYGFTAPDGEGN